MSATGPHFSLSGTRGERSREKEREEQGPGERGVERRERGVERRRERSRDQEREEQGPGIDVYFGALLFRIFLSFHIFSFHGCRLKTFLTLQPMMHYKPIKDFHTENDRRERDKVREGRGGEI